MRAAFLGATVAFAAPASAQERPTAYFYHGYDYGSDAVYNPLYVFVNRSYDVLQIRVDSRDIFDIPYGPNAKNVFENLTNPVSRISEEGWGKFTREELFPLSFGQSTSRWVPNYSLHLIGGGMTFAAMKEWYEAKGVPFAWGLSALNVMAMAFVNETLENKGVVGRNTDAIADFYFFDIGGILLFSAEPVRRFFGKELRVMDWSLQPSFTLPNGALHNHGQYFAAKWPLPFHKRLSLFSYFGLSSTAGLSYRVAGEYSVSAAGGMKSSRMVNGSPTAVQNTVEWTPTVGLFVDRNDSLLATVQVANVEDYAVNANLYPGVLPGPLRSFGLWGVANRKAQFVVGVSTTLGFGTGWDGQRR